MLFFVAESEDTQISIYSVDFEITDSFWTTECLNILNVLFYDNTVDALTNQSSP